MSAMRRGLGFLFLSVGLTLACADGSVDPVAVETAPEHGLVAGGDSVQVLTRTSALPTQTQVSRTIGPLGGTLSLPAAGLTVIVPPGALLLPTKITVVAPAGDLVGYHFFPEGISFVLPLLAVQDLSATNASLLGGGLLAAHFDGTLSPVVEALELLPLSLLQALGVFHIAHFSGYVVATN